MTLDNLVGNTLERIEPDPAAIGRLVRAAERNLADAHIETISSESRFVKAWLTAQIPECLQRGEP